ncbi:hydrolase TatD family protein, partial [Entamoeba invadens IP1]
GLDYHPFPGMGYADKETQKTSFLLQIELAKKLQKPIVLHTREADEDTQKTMTENIPFDFPMDIHCYTASLDFAKWVLEKYPNAYFGFAGVVTFKNAKNVLDVVKVVPLDKILLETDAPFMAPIPFRGKPSHSGMIPWIAETIAKTKGVSLEEVLRQTTINAKKLFKI